MTTPRQELLAAFAKMAARDRARCQANESLDAIMENDNPNDDLPLVDEHYHSSDSLQRLGPPPHTIGEVIDEYDRTHPEDVTPMDDETLLAGAFFAKHPAATAVEIKQYTRFERIPNAPSRKRVSVRYEAWITLANGHVTTERGDTFDELIQIAEQAAR